MENQIFIPSKLKVGYQKRTDTYSKKLAYVIYYDEKGKLRKETSWNGWIDKKQGIDEFENVPTEGFVLNRNVGGVKNSYGGYHNDVRIEKVRVYDPRGFEFEIDIPNVLTILQECTSTKGKGLEGSFVYGWAGPSLILIPTESEDYRKSQEYTTLQSGKVDLKSLIPGASYKTKKQQDLIYLGKFDWIQQKWGRKQSGWVVEKKHIFVDENGYDDGMEEMDIADYDSEKEYEADLASMRKDREKALKNGENYQFIPLASAATLALCNSETPVTNYAELLDRFNGTINAGIPTEFVEKPTTFNTEVKKRYGWWEMKSEGDYFIKVKDNHYIGVSLNPNDRHSDKVQPKKFEINNDRQYILTDGKFKTEYADNNYPRATYTPEQLSKMEVFKLSVKLNNNKLVKAKEYR